VRSQERGTASVELIAVIPALVVAVLVAAQVAMAGHALWSAALAARAGARAAVVDGDVSGAARQALPGMLRRGAKISDDGGVRVRVEVPRVASFVPSLRLAVETNLGGPDG